MEGQPDLVITVKSLMGLVDDKFSMSQRNHMVAKNSLIGCIRRNMVSGWREVRDPFLLIRTCLEHSVKF